MKKHDEKGEYNKISYYFNSIDGENGFHFFLNLYIL